jgi:hypothetical protein
MTIYSSVRQPRRDRPLLSTDFASAAVAEPAGLDFQHLLCGRLHGANITVIGRCFNELEKLIYGD